MQSSSSLHLPASDPPSPSSDGGAKSSRVCLNCRRKKKKCDKKLPSCGRCTYSLEFCQHEDDAAISHPPDISAQIGFNMASNLDARATFTMGSAMGGMLAPSIGPVLFATLDTTEDIHHFLSRTLAQVIGDRVATESIVKCYFATINTWFTIVERVGFEERLARSYSEPSAETALLSLCMLLIVRSPDEDSAVSMQNGLYHSVKTLCGLVATKVPLSQSILQANLLVCLYELSHLMPQQAYLSLGICIAIVRAFGWTDGSFWSQDQWLIRARELKTCSILWWSMVFLENGLQTEDLGYPRSVPNIDFAIPLPETFDPILQLSHGGQYGTPMHFADDGDGKTETIVFPEAKSASLLAQVLQQTSGQQRLLGIPRDNLNNAIIDHARTVVSTPWKDNSRFGALSLAYIAILRLNYPELGFGSYQLSYDSSDGSAVQNVLPVLESICHSAQFITSAGNLSFLGPLVPASGHSMLLAGRIIIAFGGTAINNQDWLKKVQLLRSCLEVFAKRWRVAERYLQELSGALQYRLNELHAQ